MLFGACHDYDHHPALACGQFTPLRAFVLFERLSQ